MKSNILDHPVYELLPKRTQKKLLSPVSEDKLTWDCFFALKRANALALTVATVLKLDPAVLADARLVLWGLEIRERDAVRWRNLHRVLSDVEDYRDGKREGQKTEPDVIIYSENAIVVAECKRHHGLGRCSRFEDTRCPELHPEGHVDEKGRPRGRKRPYCQYWSRGLDELVNFTRPEIIEPDDPKCNTFYQLLRNFMIGTRLADSVGADQLHMMVIKESSSAHYAEVRSEVDAFNTHLRWGPAKPRKRFYQGYELRGWSDFRIAAASHGADVLRDYSAELAGNSSQS